MATPKKKYKYTFLYTDGTYLTFELTKEDFDNVEKALTQGQAQQKFTAVSIGVIGLDGIRSIIEQKDEEPQEDTPPEDTLPPLDQESYNWFKQFTGGDK